MRARAPGRVNLIGEHTDYSGGLVLPAAIAQQVVLEGDAGGDRIHLRSDRFADPIDVPADGAEAPAEGWGRYVAAVAAELGAAGRPPVGLRGHVTSDLPAGAGLSSSAALEVAVGLALCEAAGWPLAPLDLAAVTQRAEQRAVGVPCGIMDQAASLLGEAGHAVLLDCGTLAHRLVPLPPALELLVVDSGVERRLEGSGYAARRAELEAALPALGGWRPADVTLEEAEERAVDAGLDDRAWRRLRHVVTENARVEATERALREEDLPALGALFEASHASLRDDYEVSVPQVDRLVELAREAGAVAARMTGGGFGGAIVALARAQDAQRVGEAVVERYAREGGRGRLTRAVAGPGAAVEA